MNEEIFQKVFDQLQDVIPVDWKKIIFYAGYTSGSYTMKYYVDLGDGKFIDCFELKKNSKAELIKLFIEINKIISIERNTLSQNIRWNVLTMIIDENGEMKTEFDYSDLSENSIGFEVEWKNKYLK